MNGAQGGREPMRPLRAELIDKSFIRIPTSTDGSSYADLVISEHVSNGVEMEWKPIGMRKGPLSRDGHRTFYAIFSWTEVDFKIAVDNHSSLDVCLEYETHDQGKTRFVHPSDQNSELLTLDYFDEHRQNQRQLHFQSQLTQAGHRYTRQYAQSRRISLQDAKERVSILRLQPFIEKQIIVIKGKRLALYVNNNCGRMVRKIRVNVGTGNTIDELKRLIEEIEEIPISLQRLTFNSNRLDGGTIRSNGISDGETVELFRGQTGGAPNSASNARIGQRQRNHPTVTILRTRGAIMGIEQIDQRMEEVGMAVDDQFLIEPFEIHCFLDPTVESQCSLYDKDLSNLR